MNRSTTSLSFPDVNVWLALALSHHVHRPAALAWWKETSDQIAFIRPTQISFLRLVTTAAAMDGNPLTLRQAWKVYDAFFADDRVIFLGEPSTVESDFRKLTTSGRSSPKVWADALLLAHANGYNGTIVTFDRAFAAQPTPSVILDGD